MSWNSQCEWFSSLVQCVDVARLYPCRRLWNCNFRVVVCECKRFTSLNTTTSQMSNVFCKRHSSNGEHWYSLTRSSYSFLTLQATLGDFDSARGTLSMTLYDSNAGSPSPVATATKNSDGKLWTLKYDVRCWMNVVLLCCCNSVLFCVESGENTNIVFTCQTYWSCDAISTLSVIVSFFKKNIFQIFAITESMRCFWKPEETWNFVQLNQWICKKVFF